MSIMKNILIIGLSLFFLSCNSPSEPNAKIIKDSAIYEINNYCYDVDLNDDVVVLAASDGGYYKFDIEYNDDSFPVLEQISNENNHNLDVDELVVVEAYVGKNLTLKRGRPRARGRFGKIVKPFSELTIKVRQEEEHV